MESTRLKPLHPRPSLVALVIASPTDLGAQKYEVVYQKARPGKPRVWTSDGTLLVTASGAAILQDEEGEAIGRRQINASQDASEPGRRLIIAGKLVEILHEVGQEEAVAKHTLGDRSVHHADAVPFSEAVFAPFKKAARIPITALPVVREETPRAPSQLLKRVSRGIGRIRPVRRHPKVLVPHVRVSRRTGNATVRLPNRRKRAQLYNPPKKPARYRNLLEEDRLANCYLSDADRMLEYLYGAGASKLPKKLFPYPYGTMDMSREVAS